MAEALEELQYPETLLLRGVIQDLTTVGITLDPLLTEEAIETLTTIPVVTTTEEAEVARTTTTPTGIENLLLQRRQELMMIEIEVLNNL